MRIENLPCSNYDGDVFDVNVIVGSWKEIKALLGDSFKDYTVTVGAPRTFSAEEWDKDPRNLPEDEYIVEPFLDHIIGLWFV